jgi:hypothetical protein
LSSYESHGDAQAKAYVCRASDGARQIS